MECLLALVHTLLTSINWPVLELARLISLVYFCSHLKTVEVRSNCNISQWLAFTICNEKIKMKQFHSRRSDLLLVIFQPKIESLGKMGGVRERSGKRGLAVSFNGNPGHFC